MVGASSLVGARATVLNSACKIHYLWLLLTRRVTVNGFTLRSSKAVACAGDLELH